MVLVCSTRHYLDQRNGVRPIYEDRSAWRYKTMLTI
jgi:hypothetical protein